jgi:predicted AlkP superfamily pyrophosphatase or phosphodiesterase
MRFRCLAGAALSAALVGAPGADAQPARSASLRPVLLVSIDGLKPEYLQHADSLGLRLPTLRRLLRESASARGVRGVLPTLTYPSHTTLVTGRSPAAHGVSSNTTFDPLLRNQGGWYWYAEDIRVPTLWDRVIQAGGTVGAVHWPVSVGANITWNVPQIWRTGMADDQKLIRALATPGVLDTLEQRVGVPYPDGIDESITADEERARFVARLLEWKRPTLTLAYLTAFDHEQHEAGPWTPKAFAVLERVDAALDTIVTAATRTFGDQLTVAIVSDHGFSASHSDIHLASAFVDRGFIAVGTDDRPTEWRAAIWPSGGTAAVVLADSSSALADSVHALLKQLAADTTTGIARILDRDALRAQGGYPAAAFVVAFKPGYRLGYRLRGALRTAASGGMHGYAPDEPQMRASFLIRGTGITPGTDLGLIDMRDIAPSLATRLGVTLPGAEGQPRFPPRPR